MLLGDADDDIRSGVTADDPDVEMPKKPSHAFEDEKINNEKVAENDNDNVSRFIDNGDDQDGVNDGDGMERRGDQAQDMVLTENGPLHKGIVDSEEKDGGDNDSGSSKDKTASSSFFDFEMYFESEVPEDEIQQ